MPAHTPTTITAGSAVEKSPSRLKLPLKPRSRAQVLMGPEFGFSSSRHMIATTTGGIAQGTRASDRASQRSRRSRLSSIASPSASRNCRIVTLNAQIRPILNELQKSVLLLRST